MDVLYWYASVNAEVLKFSVSSQGFLASLKYKDMLEVLPFS